MRQYDIYWPQKYWHGHWAWSLVTRVRLIAVTVNILKNPQYKMILQHERSPNSHISFPCTPTLTPWMIFTLPRFLDVSIVPIIFQGAEGRGYHHVEMEQPKVKTQQRTLIAHPSFFLENKKFRQKSLFHDKNKRLNTFFWLPFPPVFKPYYSSSSP